MIINNIITSVLKAPNREPIFLKVVVPVGNTIAVAQAAEPSVARIVLCRTPPVPL